MKIISIILISGLMYSVLTKLPSSYSFFNDSSVASDNVFTYSIIPSVSPSPVPEQSADHIVISEVQISGNTSNQDFVELYNPTSSVIHLAGWRIRKKTSTGTISTLASIPSGKIIPAHGFFLWSNSQSGYALSLSSDVSNTNTLAENNSIEIQDENAAVIDQAGWGGGSNQFFESAVFPENPIPQHSIERKAFSSSSSESMADGGEDEFEGNGFDSNNNAYDFVIRDQPSPQNSQNSTEPL